MRRFILSVFIPHAGCPQQCSFCDQNKISSANRPPKPAEVRKKIEESLDSLRAWKNSGEQEENSCQIAFYGGSFTSLDLDYMLELLRTAASFVDDGLYGGTRISARPEAFDLAMLDLLEQNKVKTIELGLQSADDEVLFANRRGHSFADAERSIALIKAKNRFELGLQMMTGLYRSTREKDIHTARLLLAQKPDFIRLYPTAVFRDTMLYDLYASGSYTPPGVEESVEICAEIMKMAAAAGVEIARAGLHGDFLSGQEPVAGAFHPAFGQLCRSRVFLDKLTAALEKKPPGRYTVYVAKGSVSDVCGQKRSNAKLLAQAGYILSFAEKAELGGYGIAVENTATA